MTWMPNDEQISLFAPSKQRSAAYTIARRALRDDLLAFAEGLPGDWDCTPAEPCLANKRQVKNLVLFSRGEAVEGRKQSIDLSSPFALDVLPYHERLSRFVQIDQSGLTWGLLLHRKAQLDGRNTTAFLDAFEGEHAFKALLAPIDDARADNDVEGPRGEGSPANSIIPRERGRGWCIWWRAEAIDEQLALAIKEDLMRLQPIVDALTWRADNDLCGAAQEHKQARAEASRSRFQVGDRVRITAGLFAGRIGRVEKRHDNGTVSLGIGPVTIQVGDNEVSPL